MSIYEAISARIQREEEYKKQQIYKYANYALVTRFSPTGEAYPVNRTYCIAKALSPTMFTPWGKVLGPSACAEQESSSQASIMRALKSIPAQLLYDIVNTIFYIIAAIPSLVIGTGYLAYASLRETDQKKKEEQIKFAQEICFGNVILTPYFAVAIVVDFLREFCALFSRSLATVMQVDEEKNKQHWPISQNAKAFRFG